MSNIRVRFAPSPTGGLHLGGVRTALYNYLFAKQHQGKFILRIEDTDQTRYVEGAEEYIMQCLEWCGLIPDESPKHGGNYGPYRQSERKAMYRQYAEKLVQEGKAYYAFDTPEELEQMRAQRKSQENPSPQYDARTRMYMRNSLTLPAAEVEKLLAVGTPHVIRIKVPENETVIVEDMIRGTVHFDTNLLDDKVLLKADGMPTYHLAVVVDDCLMEISHVFRGEEWLPSAPVHVLLWQYLGWGDKMPAWVHLPLILKPDGNGKLSKRDGERLGFPVFALDWTDPKTNAHTEGFKERGFIPEAFVNMLAMLGWNSGTEQEIFTMDELIKAFSVSKIHKGGAKFDYEKACWYNEQHLKAKTTDALLPMVKPFIEAASNLQVEDAYLHKVIELIKERCRLLTDFWKEGYFFFQDPEPDLGAIREKWTHKLSQFFENWMKEWDKMEWNAHEIATSFEEALKAHGLKKGNAMLPFRIMLVGGKFGPGVFEIAALIGKEKSLARVQLVLAKLSN